MVAINQLKKISDTIWEIPRSYRADMQVPVRLFATRRMLDQVASDRSLEQAVNSACLPGLAGQVLVMPDMHQGYGFPIGGVAATRMSDGVISPGGIGYDINCGVRLLASNILVSDIEPLVHELAAAVDQACPSGVGNTGKFSLSGHDLDAICREGAAWAKKQGMASEQDLRRTEQSGKIPDADPARVSSRARQRGQDQLGTLGSGNHFIEIGVVDEIFDVKAAQVMGLTRGCLTVMIHCGSRGFGHQICTDFVQSFQEVVRRYDIHLPDRELVCAPLQSTEGQAYLAAMRSAANFAFCNRQILAHQIRQAFEITLAGKVKRFELHQVYDVAHNIAKAETHLMDGKPQKLMVHRKGATRAFGPGAAELPEEYQSIGQPVLVPGSMGTASWVLVGKSEAEQLSFASCCHGAGRVWSRSQAKKQIRGEDLKRELGRAGIVIRAGSLAGLAEEAPQAYKDIDDVIEVVTRSQLAGKVARLKPVIVIKG